MNFIKQQIILREWNDLLHMVINSVGKVESYCEVDKYEIMYSHNNEFFYIDYHKEITNDDILIYKFINFNDLPDSEKEKYKLKLDNNGNYYYSKQNYYNKVYNDLHNINILDILKEV
jgi:hypothetical protein